MELKQVVLRIFSSMILCTIINYLTDALKFTSVQIPALVQRQANFWLVCQFRLDQSGILGNSDQLYSVKWYRNNEEFYRLLVPTGSSYSPDEQAAAGQQQYFPQAGVNVMMSFSNATHVRLLNASLDSEGLYACEISTQNLSTIRYEREIRVYVLPYSRPNIIGLRGRYSFGDKVDLICASDFSRPQPALAWFINGKRILDSSGLDEEQPASRNWFKLSSHRRSKANEPSLSKLSLTLKFRLTSELLSFFSSLSADFAPSSSSSSSSPPSSTPTYKALRLQCKYRLTELSDVAFNELQVRQPAAEWRMLSRAHWGPSTSLEAEVLPLSQLISRGQDKQVEGSARRAVASWDLDEGAQERARRQLTSGTVRRHAFGQLSRRPETSPDVVHVKKSGGSQLSQSKSPASARELLAALGYSDAWNADGPNNAPEKACAMGALALGPEDPLLVAARGVTDADEEGGGLETGPAEELRVDMLTVNCSTVSALLERQTFPAATSDYDIIPALGFSAARQMADQKRARLVDQSRKTRPLHSPAEQFPPSGVIPMADEGAFCGDASARRRALISGRIVYNLPGSGNSLKSSSHIQQNSTNSSSSGAGSLAALGKSVSVQVAYLSLSGTGGGNNASVLLAPELLSYYSADSSDWPQQQQQQHHHSSAAYLQHSSPPSPAPPPPLLEWFINNQEAPRSSTNREPELPSQETQDWPSNSTAPSVVDYTEYFANFENRPNQQHLALKLKLERRHFMTPDSLLRLKCSSSQAQLLMTDSVGAIIFPSSAQQISPSYQPLPPPSGSGAGSSSGWLPQARSKTPVAVHSDSANSSSSSVRFYSCIKLPTGYLSIISLLIISSSVIDMIGRYSNE